MPCGCVIENENPPGRQGNVIECPWCGATFDLDEMCEWFQCSTEVWVGKYRPILQFGPCLLEVTRRCECGGTIVRECGSPRSVSFHFSASAVDDSIVLRN